MEPIIQLPKHVELPDGFSIFAAPELQHLRQGSRFRLNLVYEMQLAVSFRPRVDVISAPHARSLIVLHPGEEPRFAYGSEHMFCVGLTRLARIEFVLQDSGKFVLAAWPFDGASFAQMVTFYVSGLELPDFANPSEPKRRRQCECDQLGWPYGLDSCRVHPDCTGRAGCVNYPDPLGPPHPDELQ